MYGLLSVVDKWSRWLQLFCTIEHRKKEQLSQYSTVTCNFKYSLSYLLIIFFDWRMNSFLCVVQTKNGVCLVFCFPSQCLKITNVFITQQIFNTQNKNFFTKILYIGIKEQSSQINNQIFFIRDHYFKHFAYIRFIFSSFSPQFSYLTI